jgi:hypothetical protein
VSSLLQVGDKVTFNDDGLFIAFNSVLGNAHMKTKVLTITFVDTESMTGDEPCYIVEVDDPEINQLLLLDICFTKVEG